MLRKVLLMALSFVVLFGAQAFANEAAPAAAAATDPYASLSAALAIGIAAFGGAIGQGRTATAAQSARAAPQQQPSKGLLVTQQLKARSLFQ